ncbi:MAG: hypothetical protein IPN19_01990 [Elusimicrobia bacterium]|nr:hypothetical protein [Elusimicrobiota bacterium]
MEMGKTAYKHLVAAVGKMLEEGKMAGQQADSSLAKIYWNIGDKLMEAGLIGTPMKSSAKGLPLRFLFKSQALLC